MALRATEARSRAGHHRPARRVRRHRPDAAALVAVAVAAVLAGGCGGQQPRSDPARRPAPRAADDREGQRAGASLIRLADVPPGWRRDAVPPRSNCAADTAETATDVRATGISPVLSSEPTPAGMVAVHQSVALFADPQKASTAFGKLASRRATRCLVKILMTGFHEHAIVRSPLKNTGTIRVTASTRQVNFRIKVKTSYGEGEAYVYVFEGQRRRGITALVAGSLFSPLSPTSLRAFTGLVLRRLAVNSH